MKEQFEIALIDKVFIGIGNSEIEKQWSSGEFHFEVDKGYFKSSGRLYTDSREKIQPRFSFPDELSTDFQNQYTKDLSLDDTKWNTVELKICFDRSYTIEYSWNQEKIDRAEAELQKMRNAPLYKKSDFSSDKIINFYEPKNKNELYNQLIQLVDYFVLYENDIKKEIKKEIENKDANYYKKSPFTKDNDIIDGFISNIYNYQLIQLNNSADPNDLWRKLSILASYHEAGKFRQLMTNIIFSKDFSNSLIELKSAFQEGGFELFILIKQDRTEYIHIEKLENKDRLEKALRVLGFCYRKI